MDSGDSNDSIISTESQKNDDYLWGLDSDQSDKDYNPDSDSNSPPYKKGKK